jgi:intracellular sulfur oxidation DsrE/DsrF family protein
MTRFSCRAVLAAVLTLAVGVATTAIAADSHASSRETTESSASIPSRARPPAPDIWIHPLIRGYGGVRPRPDLPSGLSPGTEYRVIVDVVHGDSDRTHVLGSLERLARLVNLLAYAGVPPDHVRVAAVIEGTAGFAALTNAAYRKRFDVDNPNLELLHALKQSGVELMVCAQALAENGLQDSDISSDVTVTLSALTDFVIYGQRGYSYLQL